MKSVVILFCLIAPVSVHAFVADPFTVPKSAATCGSDHAFAKNTCASKYTFDDAKVGCVLNEKLPNQNAEAHRYLNCVDAKVAKLVATCISQYEQVATTCSQSYEEIELSVVEGKRRQRFIHPTESDLDAALDVHLKTSLTRLQEAQKFSQGSLEDITNRTGDLYIAEKEIKTRVAEMRKLIPAPEEDPKKDEEQKKNGGKSFPTLSDVAQFFNGKPAAPQELRAMAESQSLVGANQAQYAQNPAARAGSSKETSAPAPTSLGTIPDSPDTKKEFEKSKVGEVPQQPGMSGSVASAKISSGSSTTTKAADPSQATQYQAGTSVSEGTYSGGSYGKGLTKLSPGANRWSVSQLRQRLEANALHRTPAQLRMQAGIASPHGDLFQKVKFRYNRLSSTLRP